VLKGRGQTQFGGARNSKEEDYPTRKRPWENQRGGGFDRAQYERLWAEDGNFYQPIQDRLGGGEGQEAEGAAIGHATAQDMKGTKEIQADQLLARRKWTYASGVEKRDTTRRTALVPPSALGVKNQDMCLLNVQATEGSQWKCMGLDFPVKVFTA
jgi:hypothetical protein